MLTDPTNNNPIQNPEANNNTNIQQPQASAPAAIDVGAITRSLNSVLDAKLSGFEERLMQQQQQPPPMTAEQREEMNYKLREQFDSDPMAFMEQMKSEAEQNALNKLQQQYQPMFEQTQQLNNRLNWHNKVRDFMTANPSAQAYSTEMTLILRENPQLMQSANPLQTAYQMATARELVGQNGGNVVDNMMNNNKYREQLVNNEALRQAIIQDYTNKLNGQMSQAQQMPPIMGNNQSGSTIPASGGETPRNLSEAKQSALRRIQLMQGGGNFNR